MKQLYKQLQHLPCEICGWKEATRDIHHILPVSEGGTNELSNLIVLCPNHHRMIHRGLISEQCVQDALNTRTISSPSEEGQDAVGSP
jgi:predicted restriction endonuclease